jgi:hypothetical protein
MSFSSITDLLFPEHNDNLALHAKAGCSQGHPEK